MAQCYVYIYEDENGVARYVGKGTGDRSDQHIALARLINKGVDTKKATRFTRWLAKCLREGLAFNCKVHSKGMTDEQAFAMERKLVKKHKRTSEGGTLYNLQEGGDGFTSADAKRFANQPETKLKKSISSKAAWEREGERERRSAATGEANGREHRREQARQKALQEWSKEERRAAASAKAKELWADPVWSAARREELRIRNAKGKTK